MNHSAARESAIEHRFVRRTVLRADEYRKNFRQVDADVIAAVTSREADSVTPLMSKIYLRLVNAPAQYWEREGVLRFEAELRDEAHVKAWDVLWGLLGVASATANKALRWMHEHGIIGYFAGKNGVGIRIFINRASSSIGRRAAGKKILEFTRASSFEARASTGEAAFSDSFADLEILEKDLNPRAPKNSAEQQKEVRTNCTPLPPPSDPFWRDAGMGVGITPREPLRVEVPINELVARLKPELEPLLQSAARRAAAQEHERTREWLESRGLPKVARVAQREAFNVLRKYGVINEGAGDSLAHAARSHNEPASTGPRPLSAEEVDELAQACVAMLEVQGQSVELTLSEMSVAAGGFLLHEDAPRVRERVTLLLRES